MKTTLILGGPGSGKTERLLNLVEEFLDHGIKPHDIAFVSFTTKAVNEACDRAVKRFGLGHESFPFFRTIHSLCYRQLGLTQGQVFKRKHLREVCDHLGLKLSWTSLEDDDVSMLKGDKFLFLDNLARSTGKDVDEVWHEHGSWDISWFELLRFSQTLKRYKEQRGLVDFTDMLAEYVDIGSEIGVKVMILDEAQDLTPLQWRALDVARAGCDEFYIAGDDDQAIYEWSGADVTRFLHLGEDVREVLPKSHRLPKKIFDLSQKFIERVKSRYEKRWTSRDEEGAVSFIDEPDLNLSGTWLLLARNVCFLKHLEQICVEQGVTYIKRGNVNSIDPEDLKIIKEYERARRRQGLVSSDSIWHRAEIGLDADRVRYYLEVLRNGGSLIKRPRVFINTVHGVKGGEADNVALMTDMTRATEENSEINPDSEARVFYVGMTRARKNLFIMSPITERGFYI